MEEDCVGVGSLGTVERAIERAKQSCATGDSQACMLAFSQEGLVGLEIHLACSNCGAPLHELKKIPSDANGDRELVSPSAIRKSKKKPKKHRASKKRKSSLKDFVAYKFWDAAEDVFDDVFDIFD